MRKLTALVALASALALGGGSIAGALSGEEVKYEAKEGNKVTKTFGPVPASEPAQEAVSPSLCQAAPSCMAIPLTVTPPPGFDPEVNDYVVGVVMTWDDRRIDANNQGNDMNIYAYDVNDEKEGPRLLSRATTSRVPEALRLFSPVGKFVLAVSNAQGVNTGFKLDFTFGDRSFQQAIEEAEDAQRPATGDEPAPAPTPSDDGGGGSPAPEESASGPEASPAPDGPEAPAPLTPAPATGTFALGGDGFGDDLDGADEFGFRAPPEQTAADLFRQTSRGTSGPVSGLVLTLWLLVAPLALLTAAILLFLRQRPAALSMSLPRAG